MKPFLKEQAMNRSLHAPQRGSFPPQATADGHWRNAGGPTRLVGCRFIVCGS
jgi:hypothetical protein